MADSGSLCLEIYVSTLPWRSDRLYHLLDIRKLYVHTPLCFAHSIRASPESLCRNRQIISFVLQRIESISTFRDFIDIVPHYAEGAVDFGLYGCCSRIAGRAIGRARSRYVWIVLYTV